MTNYYAEAAKNLPGHWMKNMYEDNNGNRCLLSHVGYVMTAEEMSRGQEMQEWHTAVVFMETLVEEFTNGKFHHVPDFNDADDTTEADALAFLEKAAIRYDEVKDLTAS